MGNDNKGKINMYIDLLKEKILQQQKVYSELKSGRNTDVCYQALKVPNYGTQDKNYTNRLRLVYYLFYEKIEDEEAVLYLFKEELKDRKTNSFQGIGDTLEILTCMLRKYNAEHKYDDLFTQAKNANFDCFCGYDVNIKIIDELSKNDLLDCIYLCQTMEYKDVMEQLVEEWKDTISEWNDSNRITLTRFYSFLGKEKENEELYKKLLESALQTGKASDIVSAYNKMIQYYLGQKEYDTAKVYLDKVRNTGYCQEIQRIRLFGDLLEAAFEIVCNSPETTKELWNWSKIKMREKTNRYGNLYQKGIAAAKAAGDSYADQLEQEYSDWWKAMH